MMSSRSEVPRKPLGQADFDWLVSQHVSTSALMQPTPVTIASGFAAGDGLFEPVDDAQRWLAFEEPEDIVFWQPRYGTIATYANRAFALGEAAINNPGTYALDSCLTIFTDPLEWLRAERDGIVVLDWSVAFDRLRDAPRITIAEELWPLYRLHMKPTYMPELFVVPAGRCAA